MADALYPLTKAKMMQGSLDMSSVDIKCLLVTSAYTYSAAHDFEDDLTGVEEQSAAMTTKTFTSGTFDADDVTFSATAGSACNAFIIFYDTGTPATSMLIAYIDSASGFPVTLGGDVTLAFDAAGIFTL